MGALHFTVLWRQRSPGHPRAQEVHGHHRQHRRLRGDAGRGRREQRHPDPPRHGVAQVEPVGVLLLLPS